MKRIVRVVAVVAAVGPSSLPRAALPRRMRASTRTSSRSAAERHAARRPSLRRCEAGARTAWSSRTCRWATSASGCRSRASSAPGRVRLPLRPGGHGFSEGRQNHRRAAADIAAAVPRCGARREEGRRHGCLARGIAALVATRTSAGSRQGRLRVRPVAIPGTLNAMSAVKQLDVPTLYVVSEEQQNPPYDFAADAQTLYDKTGTDGTAQGPARVAARTFLVDRSAAVRHFFGCSFAIPSTTVGS